MHDLRRLRHLAALHLASPRKRHQVYALVAALYGVLALGFFIKNDLNYIASDARKYYVYLPSLVIDRDLDFGNQYGTHWGAEFESELLTERTERGYPKNKYPVGVGLTLLPSFLVAHAMALVMSHTGGAAAWYAADGYSIPYQVLGLATILALGWASLTFIDRVTEERLRIPGWAIAGGVLTYFSASNYAWYFLREPFMVHVVSAFWVSCIVLLAHRVAQRASAGGLDAPRLVAMGLAFGMAVVCRPTNAIGGMFAAWAAIAVTRSVGWRRFAGPGVLAVVAAVVPAVVQMAVWYVMTGHFIYYSYEDEGFHWTRPKLLQSLFSSRHGLFTWSPVLLLAIPGLAVALRSSSVRRDPLIACYGFTFLALWYVNASWSTWWFGASFGGRAYIEVGGLFLIGFALALERARTAGPVLRWGTAGFLACSFAFHWVLVYLYGFSIIPRVADPLE